ncbi:MAG: C39 family peptidase [Huintestinicola sp.]
MKNFIVCLILGISVLICTMVIDYVYTDSLREQREDNRAIYAFLDADPHRQYCGYTIEEICEGYSLPETSFEKVMINMDVLNQYPEMPVGCEITCGTALLNFLGYDISMSEFADTYVKINQGTFYENDDTLVGPDPSEYFIGDPYSKGFGCYAPVIVNALNNFFESKSSKNLAIELSDTNTADLERFIDGGVPVIVWASIDMKPFRYKDATEWISDSTGEQILWPAGSHTLILVGYDDNFYYFMDPNNKSEIQKYIKDSFVQRWQEKNCQSIAVKLTP